MIDQHNFVHTQFTPHCFVCGEELTDKDTVISYKGFKAGSPAAFGNTIWLHKDCVVQLVSYLTNDLRKLL